MWGLLSDERTGLPFTIAAGPCQPDTRLPQPGGPDPHIYIPQEQGGPVIPPGTGFPFRHLLRLEGLWWRYSNLLHAGYPLSWSGFLIIEPQDGPNRQHHLSIILTLLVVVMRTCLLSRCLDIDVSSGSTVLAFGCHVTIFL
jgi:hypothetical protein